MTNYFNSVNESGWTLWNEIFKVLNDLNHRLAFYIQQNLINWKGKLFWEIQDLIMFNSLSALKIPIQDNYIIHHSKYDTALLVCSFCLSVPPPLHPCLSLLLDIRRRGCVSSNSMNMFICELFLFPLAQGREHVSMQRQANM